VSAEEPTDDERLLWSLRRRSTDVRCLLLRRARPLRILVLQGQEPVLTERFHSEDAALQWARAYELRLRDLGYADSPPHT
jgi:hypothetical protein